MRQDPVIEHAARPTTVAVAAPVAIDASRTLADDAAASPPAPREPAPAGDGVANFVNIRPLRAIRRAARVTGLLSPLEKRLHRPGFLWFRSLLALHDIEDLVRLDVPWWTLRSARMVGGFLGSRPEARVFEYGAGASTVWLAKRCRDVGYVEHDAGWNEVVREQTTAFGNVRGVLKEPREVSEDEADTGDPTYRSQFVGHTKLDYEAYVRAIEAEPEPFDMITIDGRCRVQCLGAALSKLKPDGVIVFDNTNRKRYKAAARATGLPSISTRGLTPCLPYPGETTLLFKDRALRDEVAAVA